MSVRPDRRLLAVVSEWRSAGGGPLLRPVLVGVGVAGVAALIGISPADALLAGAVTVALVVVGTAMGVGEEHPWPEARVEATDGTRREIAALSWTFVGRDGKVSEAAVRRLRAVASRRLARHGIVLDETLAGTEQSRARARALLGDRAWQILSGPGGWLPSLTDLTRCVHALDSIGPNPVPDERPRP